MQYEFHIISVEDADALVLNYKANENERWWTAVVDAGNVGDGVKVKPCIKHIENGKHIIDYAFCSHPDKDHKGGFFDLLTDNQVEINTFYIRRPDIVVRNDYRRLQFPLGKLEADAKAVYNHPNNPEVNLIDLATKNSHLCEPAFNADVVGMPLKMIGPREPFFKEACVQMALNFAEIEDEQQPSTYAEDELPSEEDAQSVMDEEKETSPTNKSSLILLFHPGDRYFLLSGDACSATIHDAIDDHPQELSGCTVKVPHHGSKHNLTTEVIDLLRPVSAVISCKGSKKHPNPAVVHFLSKHCNVYSTHKSGSLVYHSLPVKNPAIALRKKQE